MVNITKRVGSWVLRFVAFGATLAAAIVMATTHERAYFFTFPFEANYSHMPAFKYYVITNAVVCGYSFLVLFLPEESLLWKFVVVLDLVLTMVLTSSVSAALAVAEVGKRGNAYTGWVPICGQLAKFCDHVTVALIAGFIALLLYIFLLLFSLHSIVDPFLLQKS